MRRTPRSSASPRIGRLPSLRSSRRGAHASASRASRRWVARPRITAATGLTLGQSLVRRLALEVADSVCAGASSTSQPRRSSRPMNASCSVRLIGFVVAE